MALTDWHGAHWPRAPWALAAWLGGGLPRAFHGLVLGLHLLNGALLWPILRRWLSPMAAVLTLTLFWLHPLQVESVAYVSGGIDVLVTTYALLAVMLFLGGEWMDVAMGAVCLSAAVLVKPSARPLIVAVPAVVLIATGRWTVRVQAAVYAAASLLAIPTLWVMALRSAPLGERLLSVRLWAVGLVGLLARLWPRALSIEHDWSQTSGWLAVSALCALAAAGLLAWQIRARWAAPWWAWVWIVGLTLPRALVPNAPPLLEHHTYVVFLAIWLLAGAIVDRLLHRAPLPRPVTPPLWSVPCA